jgi:hypothetical protein
MRIANRDAALISVKERIMSAHILSGEASRTLLAAIYPDHEAAERAAASVARRVPFVPWQLSVLQPGDSRFARKVEPERLGIKLTLIRSHVWAGLAGLIAGLLGSGLMIAMGWLGAHNSPGVVTATIATFCTMGGLMLGGLLSLRPDHAYVIEHLHNALAAGKWAVVARPTNKVQTREALSSLDASGGEVLRSV